MEITAIDPPAQSGHVNASRATTPSDRDIAIQTNRKGFIEVAGEVIELLPAATFKVKLDNGQMILCHLSGRMRMNRIMLLPGDKVRVEMTPYDLSKGRITYRF